MKTIDGQLFVENIPVIELAKEYGSPLFIYSSKEIEDNFNQEIDELSQETENLVTEIEKWQM